MAAVSESKVPSLAEDWSLPAKEPQSNVSASLAENVENIVNDSITQEQVEEKDGKPPSLPSAEETNSGSESSGTPVSDATDEKDEVEATSPATELVIEANSPAVEEENEAPEEEVAEDKPEIKIETAPADFRFPTTNQTRHCFTRYVEYHRCTAAKGEDAPECQKFAKYYRSLCPGEWVERWNEQRENGTFPGPL